MNTLNCTTYGCRELRLAHQRVRAVGFVANQWHSQNTSELCLRRHSGRMSVPLPPAVADRLQLQFCLLRQAFVSEAVVDRLDVKTAVFNVRRP